MASLKGGLAKFSSESRGGPLPLPTAQSPGGGGREARAETITQRLLRVGFWPVPNLAFEH